MKRKLKLTRWFANILNGCYIGFSVITPQILGRKSFQKFFKHKSSGKATWSQPFAGDMMPPTSQKADIAPIAIANVTGWIFQIQFIKHQLRLIYKLNQLRQNGDLAGLDFVVSRTAYSVISGFRWSLESSCGYIVWKLVEYCFEANWHIFVSSNRSICCISSSFEGNKANWPIQIKESSTF